MERSCAKLRGEFAWLMAAEQLGQSYATHCPLLPPGAPMACSSKILITIEGARKLRMPPSAHGALPPKSPFCELHYALAEGSGTLRTRVHHGAGAAPAWRERFAFTLSGELTRARFVFVMRDDFSGVSSLEEPKRSGGAEGEGAKGAGSSGSDEEADAPPKRHLGSAMLRLSDLAEQLSAAEPSHCEPIRRRLALLDASSVQTGELTISMRLVLHAVRARLFEGRLGIAARAAVDVASAAATQLPQLEAASVPGAASRSFDHDAKENGDRGSDSDDDDRDAVLIDADPRAWGASSAPRQPLRVTFSVTGVDRGARRYCSCSTTRRAMRRQPAHLVQRVAGLAKEAAAAEKEAAKKRGRAALKAERRKFALAAAQALSAAQAELRAATFYEWGLHVPAPHARSSEGNVQHAREHGQAAGQPQEGGDETKEGGREAAAAEADDDILAPFETGGETVLLAVGCGAWSGLDGRGGDGSSRDDRLEIRAWVENVEAPASALAAATAAAQLGEAKEVTESTGAAAHGVAEAAAMLAQGHARRALPAPPLPGRELGGVRLPLDLLSPAARHHHHHSHQHYGGHERHGHEQPLSPRRELPLIPEFSVGARRVKREAELMREAQVERARRAAVEEQRREAVEREAAECAALLAKSQSSRSSSRASSRHATSSRASRSAVSRTASRATSRVASRAASRSPSPEPELELERGLRVAASGELSVELERVRLVAGCTPVIVAPRTTPAPLDAVPSDEQRVAASGALYARARARFREYGGLSSDGLSLAARLLPDLLLDLGAGVGAPRVLEALCARYHLPLPGDIEPVTAEQAEQAAKAAAEAANEEYKRRAGSSESTFLTDSTVAAEVKLPSPNIAAAPVLLGPETMVRWDAFVEFFNEACEEGRGSAWEQYYDVSAGRFFYFDAVGSGVCQWAPPADWRGATDAERLAPGGKTHTISWRDDGVTAADEDAKEEDEGKEAAEDRRGGAGAKAEAKEPEIDAQEVMMRRRFGSKRAGAGQTWTQGKALALASASGRRATAKDRKDKEGFVQRLQKGDPAWLLAMDENANGR